MSPKPSSTKATSTVPIAPCLFVIRCQNKGVAALLVEVDGEIRSLIGGNPYIFWEASSAMGTRQDACRELSTQSALHFRSRVGLLTQVTRSRIGGDHCLRQRDTFSS